MEAPSIIYEVSTCLDGPRERSARSTGRECLKIRPIIAPCLDQTMRHACHLGGDRAEGLALAIRILGISLDISRILFAKRILPHPDRPIRGHPEGIAEPRIAMLREPAHPTELCGLLRAEIEPTELEALSVMRKPAQVPAAATIVSARIDPTPGKVRSR